MKVQALVRMNGSLAIVFSRMPKINEYVKEDGLLWGSDHGFYSCYYYDRPCKAFQAFGGRKFELPLKGGGVEKCQGQWWDGGSHKIAEKKGIQLMRVSLNTIENLKRCYVFYGSYIDSSVYDYLIKSYKGEIYAYYDYKKVINYDDLNRKYFRQQAYFKQAKKHLLDNFRGHLQALKCNNS